MASVGLSPAVAVEDEGAGGVWVGWGGRVSDVTRAEGCWEGGKEGWVG